MKFTRECLKVLGLAAMVAGLVYCSSGGDTPIGGPGGTTGGGSGNPLIFSITPTEGSVFGGTVVVITGQRLAGVSQATLAGVAATILQQSDGTLVLLSGEHPNKAQDTFGDVVVRTNTGATGAAANAWAYRTEDGRAVAGNTACPPFWPEDGRESFTPETVGLTDEDIDCDFNGDTVPEQASFSFTGVRIEGSNLLLTDQTPGNEGNTFQLAGVPVDDVDELDDQFAVVNPGALPPGGNPTGPITVVSSGGTVTSRGTFTYIQGGVNPLSPDATSISPATVSAAGGVIATITGTNLGQVEWIQFVNSATTATDANGLILSKSATQLTVQVPRFNGNITGASLSGFVTVFTGDPADMETLRDPTPVPNFTYLNVLANAQCTGFSPDPFAGTEGTTLTIFGDGLGDLLPPPLNPDGTEVEDFVPDFANPAVDGDPLFVDADGDGEPDGATYRDTDGDGLADQVRFDLNPVPRICEDSVLSVELLDDFGSVIGSCQTDFVYDAPFEVPTAGNPTPPSGAAEGDTELTINGCGLEEVTSVTICGNPVVNLRTSGDGTELIFDTPPSPTGTDEVCDVVVATPTDSVRLRNAFQYNSGLPDGQSMVPNVGPLCGGTQFRMFGEKLTEVDIVRFGPNFAPNEFRDVDVDFVNITGTELLAVTPENILCEFNELAPIVAEVFAIDDVNGTKDDGDDLVDPTPLIFVFGNPEVTSVTTCLRPGDTATLVGEGFRDPSTGRNLVESVLVGLTEVPATVTSSTTLTFVVPPVGTGDFPVTITVPNNDDACDCGDGRPGAALMRVFDVEQDAVCAPDGCTDGVDNDGDGSIDCTDTPDCACPAGAVCNNVTLVCDETDCRDGVDNDGDGSTDCSDSPDCDCGPGSVCDAGSELCVETDCADGSDNDGDGFTDCEDFDCDLLPCDDGFACTDNDACNANVCTGTRNHAFCDNGLFCDGNERCREDLPAADANGCIDRPDPCNFAGVGCDEDADVCIETACDDSIDNDGLATGNLDGADCADSDCIPAGVESEPCTCSDTLDNDGDGCTDGPGVATDSDCGGFEAINPGGSPRCTNGIDDDCDGLIDEADPDCCPFGIGDPRCDNPCLNETDDDQDGVTDGDDPNCFGLGDGCRDGLDNDGDGRFDEADLECFPAGCTDGVNNDGLPDGTDCFDANCCVDPACPPGTGVCP